MNEPKISVIIPVYKTQAYIDRCLTSISNSTYKNLEIICINDGSPDNSGEIIKQYQRAVDNRVRLIETPNRGLSAARNTGIEAAQGEYIAFVDSDDWVHPRCFELLMLAIENADIAHCNYLRVSAPVDTYDEPYTIQVLDSKNRGIDKLICHCWENLYRRNVIGDIRFAEHIRYYEDKLFTALVYQNAEKIAFLSSSLYYYFVNSSSIVHTHEPSLFLPATEFLLDAKENKHALSLKYAYTGFFSYRYLNMFKPEAREIREQCNTKLKECKSLAKELLPLTRRLALNAFADIEILYRLYRLLTDRTLIAWEKEQKQKYI